MGRHKWILALVLALLLTGCGISLEPPPESPEENEPVLLRAITLGTAPADGLDALYEQLDALTVPELGCVLRFEYIPWGDERNQINLAIASGEYDFFPQGNFSDYQLLASRNAFLDIKPYLQFVPELTAHYQQAGSDVLEATEMDGKLFGIPQYAAPGINANEGFFYREDLRVQWGLEPVTDLGSMEAYLYRAKDDPAFRNNPLITDNRFWNGLWNMLTSNAYFDFTSYAVIAIDKPFQAVNRVKTPEFHTMLTYIQKWYQDGILDKRLLTLSSNEGASGLALFLDGEKPCETNTPIWSLNRDWLPQLTEAHPDWEYGFFVYDGGGRKLQYKTGASHGSLISISSRTQHPEIAVRLLEKLHTDQRYYDLLLFGVEGIHYDLEDGVVNRENIPAEGRYVGWTAGTDSYMDRPVKYCDNEMWMNQVYLPHTDQYEAQAESVPFSPLNDFHFNATPVSSQEARLAEVWSTYMMPLLCGLSEDIDADLQIALVRMQEAGLEDYLAEVQRQLTAFQREKDMAEE
ncbi:MAG: ABC transporter substrate-binding protein [Oscillospiraceae bacterium]|nr:ABC transporter substrate-binding protein [Oscillospiraceae bacterium]